MSNNEGAFGVMYVKLKPHLLMVLVQLVLSFLYFLVEASLNKGMNPHVFVTYRHAVGGIVVLPFAYIRERYILYPYVTCFLIMVGHIHAFKSFVKIMLVHCWYFIPVSKLCTCISSHAKPMKLYELRLEEPCSRSSVDFHSYLIPSLQKNMAKVDFDDVRGAIFSFPLRVLFSNDIFS